MARKPRPVNPDDGPVQAFAFDLRALRESAGNPTYRALARTAGYSPTTLGDAAGGVQLPTLEVTAAYVGACGGDVEAWRARWQEVNRELARERVSVVEETDEAGEAAESTQKADETTEGPLPAQGDAEPRPQRSRRRSYALWTSVSAVAVGALIIAATSMTDPTPKQVATAPSCPAIPPSGSAVAFTGTTYKVDTNVRSGASLAAPVRLRIPANCSIPLSGYCLGDVVMDQTAGTPDMRWFIIPGVGEVSSGIVHGNPPASLNPQACPDDVPGPTSIALALVPSTSGGVIALSATGSRLGIVGFAAYYASQGSSTADWHPLGFGATATAGTFSSRPLRIGAFTSPIPVVAAACLGGDGPTSVIASGAVQPGTPQTLRAMSTTDTASTARAAQAACAYPASGT